MAADGCDAQFEQRHSDGEVLQRDDTQGRGRDFNGAAEIVDEGAGFLCGGRKGQGQEQGDGRQGPEMGDGHDHSFAESGVKLRPAMPA